MKPVAVISLLLCIFSCRNPSTDNLASNPVIFTVNGTVTEVTPGKDGYTAILKDKNGESYFIIMSRIRLKEKFFQFHVDDRVTVSGDTLLIGLHVNVLATDAKTLVK
jgi:hypothetical protein